MAYTIAEPCIDTKDTACVEVCPVDCIHPKKEAPEFESENKLYIDPETCIDCGACVPVCPVKAITKVGKGQGYHIDYDICIRCGLCVRKCPCGSMKMVQD